MKKIKKMRNTTFFSLVSYLLLLRCLLHLLLLVFSGSFAYGLRSKETTICKLTSKEVEALNSIHSELELKGIPIYYDENSCQNDFFHNVVGSNIKCSRCTFESNTSHVINLTYDNQDCTGIISSKVVDLVYLERIDLSNNMLHGSIPNLWNMSELKYLDLSGNMLVGGVPDYLGTMPSLWMMNLNYNFLVGPIPPTLGLLRGLRYLDLRANCLTGKIPWQLGNISTLGSLYLEDNLLNGTLPHKLGELSKLLVMLIGGNNFTGKLPLTFKNLVNLEDFSVRGNSFNGRINFMEKWKQLVFLNLIGNNFEGPLPTGLFKITSLKLLWVTDMKVTKNLSFPQLSRLKELKFLVLRNCSIVGSIPEYIGAMNLRNLDLSFNLLDGKIPRGLQNLSFLGLSRNNFQGPIPNWVSSVQSTNDTIMMDFSHNYFSSEFSSNLNKSHLNFFNCCNVFASTMNSPMQIPYTLTGKCPSMHSSLRIDCGGNGTFVNGKYYESDNANLPFYVSPNKNWAYSTTGDFLYFIEGDRNYTKKSRCGLFVPTAPLYETARISPLALDYYGLCLHSGNYNVTLYFSEISFGEENDHSILGKRIFDIVIQGETVLKDFLIKPEDVVIKNFTANVRDNNLLSIHMYWKGKGSINIGSHVYGPLISAISAVPLVKHQQGLSGLNKALIAAALFFLLISILLYWKWGFMGRKKLLYDKLEGVELQETSVTIQHVLDATRNFSHEFEIGGGGSAIVYKANLPGGMHAVKKMKPTATREFGTFSNELRVLKDLKNDNIVELLWWYSGHGHHLLIYKYMENKSLYNALFEARLELNWETRYKICSQIAKGLVYLHGLAENKIIHRDIKTRNILLDGNLNAKISDFGLARYYNDQVRTCLTTSYGTQGYMPPEYSRQGLLSEKTDVYSYGIVVLEIVSGKESVSNLSSEESRFLVDEAYILKKQGRLLHLIDRNYVKDYVENEAYKLLRLAMLCTNQTAQLRPTMLDVLNVLEGKPIEHISATQRSNLITDSMH